MAESRNSLHPSDNGSGDSSFHIQELITEYAGSNDEGSTAIRFAELRVFGLGEERGKVFSLYEASPGELAMTPHLELPPGIKGIKCMVRGEGGEDITVIHLGGDARPREDLRPGERMSEPTEWLDAQLQLLTPWRMVTMRAKAATNGDPTSIQAQLNHWRTLYNRFQTTGNLSDISEAISTLHRVVEMTRPEDQDLAARLNNLGSSFSCRFRHKGDLNDLAEAMSLQTRAVGLTPEGHADLPSPLNNRGNSFLYRFEHTGDLADIAQAISSQTKAVHLTPGGHADLPARPNNLGNSFLSRFQRTGDLGDIAQAISAQTKAVHLTPGGHADLPAPLNNLGNSFLSRFQRTGDLGDIAQAISAQTKAVHLTPGGHADLPARLNNLGNSFLCRFQRTGDLGDIAQAISAQTQAVHLTPGGHADLPGQLNNQGNSFLSRFQRTGDLGDIAQAISAQTKAVHLTPEGHADLPSWLCSLGNSFLSRFQRTGNLADIAEAISAQTQAVCLTPEGHADLPAMRSNLGSSYMKCFQHTGHSDDAREGIYNLSQAVRLTPSMHANLPTVLMNLALAGWHCFTSSHTQDHLAMAISNFKSAATCGSGSPHIRIRGAAHWARLCNSFNPKSVDVLTAYETAIHLLALIAGLEQTVHHRYTMIGEWGNLPAEAAAAALRRGQPHTALEWLEQGRCLVWGQQSRLRTPFDELMAYDPSLASQVIDVSRHLEVTGSSRQHSGTSISWDGKASLENEALKHSQLAGKWEHLLEHIRTIPGFAAFFKPLQSPTILQHLPESGFIVVLNIHKDQCDALMLSAQLGGPLHIPLPSFTSKKAKEYQMILNTQLSCYGLRACSVGQSVEALSGRGGGLYRRKAGEDSLVHLVLKGLWNNVVKPILNQLGMLKRQEPSANTLPRIWWCPTGPLSFLPLHAAGIYRRSAVESVADYAISSYTPSVTALTQRVKNSHPIDRQVSGLFLTCQPKAPGVPRISGTTTEVNTIHNEAVGHGIRSLSLEGGAVTADGCLEYMEQYSSIHLACHAFQDTSDPLRSRFLFHNGKLYLNSIMQMNLANADLAFLSACQTSAGQEDLPNEAVHLAAGMLAAGYRRVIATMWAIGDQHAPQVASDFYGYLWSHRPEDSGSRFDGTLSAYALHHTTQKLRGRLDTTDRSLLAWIPYVHFGY